MCFQDLVSPPSKLHYVILFVCCLMYLLNFWVSYFRLFLFILPRADLYAIYCTSISRQIFDLWSSGISLPVFFKSQKVLLTRIQISFHIGWHCWNTFISLGNSNLNQSSQWNIQIPLQLSDISHALSVKCGISFFFGLISREMYFFGSWEG